MDLGWSGLNLVPEISIGTHFGEKRPQGREGERE